MSKSMSKSMSNAKTSKYGIFIFRKDLRFEDNRGLNKLAELCDEILPIFIFDPVQVDSTPKTKNYLSFPALRFICEGVKDLATRIANAKSNAKSNAKLHVFYGNPVKVLEYIVGLLKKKNKLDEMVIGFNADYTEYSIVRDNLIEEFCNSNQINLIVTHDDYVLVPMDQMLKEPGIPYKQFGAFKKNILTHKKNIFKPIYKNFKWCENLLAPKSLTFQEIDNFWQEQLGENYNPVEIGSRALGTNILKNLTKFKKYNEMRNTLSYQTTRISAYLNFGLISEREFYWSLISKLGSQTQLIDQIFWREYYLCLMRYEKMAKSYTAHIDPRYNKLKWLNKIPEKSSDVWIEWDHMMKSQTGFLLVDAGIRELMETGFMHNRVRMIVGVFSVKYLGINPLCKYVGLNDWFSRHLVDCVTSQNKLNSQWITELDFPGKKFSPSDAPIAGRPMNVSNTMIKKWDPDCAYIKKWLPHLANIDNKILINWDTKHNVSLHPKPMFDPKQRYLKWISLCKNI